MKINVNLRHFKSGNVDRKQVEKDLQKRFKFLEKFIMSEFPVEITLKYKGKDKVWGFLKRPLAYQSTMKIKLVSGEELFFSAEGREYDEVLSNLKKKAKENVVQTKERCYDKKKKKNNKKGHNDDFV